MNNPMEYFREGAEKRKADSLKDKSMYGHGNEVYGPKTQSESELEKLQMLNDIGLLGNQQIITPKPLNANLNLNQGPRSIPNPNYTPPGQRPKRPMSPIQKAMLRKLTGIKNP